MKSISSTFPISEEEFSELDKKFGDLCNFASWQLKRRNVKNNSTEELEDFIQELKMSIIRAGSYYKRQIYIESCLLLARRHAQDDFTRTILKELIKLWKNRKRHGANRQKFGDYQERILERIVNDIVPNKLKPKKDDPLRIDEKFARYCKAITWNTQRAMGKKITKELSLRNGLVSLSEFDYLGKSSERCFNNDC